MNYRPFASNNIITLFSKTAETFDLEACIKLGQTQSAEGRRILQTRRRSFLLIIFGEYRNQIVND